MLQTNDQVPSIIIANTLPGMDWENPSNILFPDDQFAVAGGSTQILTVGFVGKINVPVGATVNNIIVSVKGYRGSFNTTLSIYAVDYSSGAPVYYLMTPTFQGFNGTNTLYQLPATLFGNIWSINAINNLALQLISDGELHLDNITVNVLYTPAVVTPSTTVLDYNTLAGGIFNVGNIITGASSGAIGTVVTDNGVNQMTLSGVAGTFVVGETITNGLGVSAVVASPTGLLVCDEFVQALPFQLAASITSTSLSMLLTSFNYPDGVTPIQIGDFHGEALGVLDQGILGKEETVRIVNVQQNYNGSGQVLITFGTIANRGLGFDWPYASVPALRQDHGGTAEFVLSNPAAFYDRFVKKCQADALFSLPVIVDDEGVQVTPSLHEMDFVGAGVQTILTADHKVQVKIPGSGGTQPAVPVGVGSGSTGNIKATSLTYQLPISGINRGAYIGINISNEANINGVTVGGVAATLKTTHTATGIKQEQWFLVAPALGTLNVVITLSAPAYINSGAVALVGVDPAAPTGNNVFANANSNTVSNNIVNSRDNSVILDILGTVDAPLSYTKGAGMAQEWQRTAALDVVQSAGGYQPSGLTPDTITMAWAISKSTAWLHSILEIKGITSGGTGTQSGIQFEDEGVPLGAIGTVDEVDFTGAGITATRVGNKLTVNVPSPGGGSGSSLTFSVTQAGHGLIVGDVIKSSGAAGAYAKAMADSAVNAEVVGIVTVVTDANHFTYAKDIMEYAGAGIPAGTPGEAIFLSPSVAGAMTVTEPTVAGQISKPIGVLITSAAKLNFTSDYRGQEVQTTPILSGSSVTKAGIFQKLGNSNTTTVIPHGLGVVPDFVEIVSLGADAVSKDTINSIGTFDGTNINTVYNFLAAGSGFLNSGISTTKIINLIFNSGGVDQSATIAIDSVNITLTWTVNGGGTAQNQSFLWKAITGGGGGNSESNLVGVGSISNTSYFNTQIPFINNGESGAASNVPWTNSVGVTMYGSWISLNAGASHSVTLRQGVMNNLQFNQNKIAIVQYLLRYISLIPAAGSYHGFSERGKVPGAAGANQPYAAFKINGGNLEAECQDDAGASSSSGAIAGVVLTDRNVFRIEMDPANATPQVRFYVNGILKATRTTNLPFTGTDTVGFGILGVAVNNDLEYASCPTFSMQL